MSSESGDEDDARLQPGWWGWGEGAAAGEEQLEHVRTALGDPHIVRITEFAPWSAGGAAGDMFKLEVETDDGRPPQQLCAKFAKADATTSKANGLAREAIFLSHVPPTLAPLVPPVRFAASSLATGRKVIVSERLACAQAGHFFGDHNPLNHGRDLAALTAAFPDLSERDICLAAARLAGRLHASMWNDRATLAAADPPPAIAALRARQWLLHAADRESWQTSMDFARAGWEAVKARTPAERGELVLSEDMAAMFEAALQKATWEELQENLAQTDLTLVHGDFHPANMLVVAPGAGGPGAGPGPGPGPGQAADDCVDPANRFSLRLVDWEVVGVGCGPQDLGQFMLSHSRPEERRRNEPAVLEAYTSTLNSGLAATGKPTLSLEQVRRRYADGAIGRFMWMGPVIMRICPAGFAMYFVQQIQAFAADHGITAANVPAARA